MGSALRHLPDTSCLTLRRRVPEPSPTLTTATGRPVGRGPILVNLRAHQSFEKGGGPGQLQAPGTPGGPRPRPAWHTSPSHTQEDALSRSTAGPQRGPAQPGRLARLGLMVWEGRFSMSVCPRCCLWGPRQPCHFCTNWMVLEASWPGRGLGLRACARTPRRLVTSTRALAEGQREAETRRPPGRSPVPTPPACRTGRELRPGAAAGPRPHGRGRPGHGSSASPRGPAVHQAA